MREHAKQGIPWDPQKKGDAKLTLSEILKGYARSRRELYGTMDAHYQQCEDWAAQAAALESLLAGERSRVKALEKRLAEGDDADADYDGDYAPPPPGFWDEADD